MTVTLPASPQEGALTEADLRTFHHLLKTESKLAVDGRTIRPATLWDLFTDTEARITRLFTELVTQAQQRSPGTNQADWTMQAARLWKEGHPDKRLSKEFRRMQLGLCTERGCTDEEIDDFTAWARKHHQQHTLALRDITLQVHEGHIQLPIVNEDSVDWVDWRVATTWTDQGELFEPHPERAQYGEWAHCHLSERGYTRGFSWPYDPRPSEEEELDAWSKIKPYKQSRVSRHCFVAEVWTDDVETLNNNHTAVLLQKGYELYSVGTYRDESFSFKEACKPDLALHQCPDLSHYLWQYPVYLRSFAFEMEEDEVDEALERLALARRDQTLVYRAPDLVCQQSWSVVLDRTVNIGMDPWSFFGGVAYAYVARPMLSYLPSPLRSGVSLLAATSFDVVSALTPLPLKWLGGLAAAPLENTLAWALYGGEGFGGTCPTKPLMDRREFWTKRHNIAYPTAAVADLRRLCSEYEQRVRDNNHTYEPPGGRETWLDMDHSERLYPRQLLDQFGV